jgi:hypothetical protein
MFLGCSRALPRKKDCGRTDKYDQAEVEGRALSVVSGRACGFLPPVCATMGKQLHFPDARQSENPESQALAFILCTRSDLPWPADHDAAEEEVVPTSSRVGAGHMCGTSPA